MSEHTRSDWGDGISIEAKARLLYGVGSKSYLKTDILKLPSIFESE